LSGALHKQVTKVVKILSGISTVLVILGGWSWLWGFKLGMRQYQILALYLLGFATTLALIAIALWAISRAGKNVKIQ
jgi:uncharacterized membrane protein YuzA (DUF378 family)